MDETEIIIMVVLATVVGGYITASIILLKFPHLLHKRKKLKFRPTHISHRGGAGENCENTIGAFKHALKQGTQMLELDCHMTKDGVVVVSHDGHLLNKCGEDVNIAEVNLADLPCYKSELKVDFKPGCMVECGEDRRIPTLREVFKQFPSTPINIDVKVYDEQLFHKVHDLIREFGRETLTIWGGRRSDTTKALYNLDPSIPVFFSFNRVFSLLFFFYTGLLPFIPLYESTLEVLMPSIALREGAFPAQLSLKFRILLRIFDTLLMRPALFRHLEKRGIQTYLWVLNDDEDFARAYRLGAAGVMTDFPSKLAAFLKSQPQHEFKVKDVESTEKSLLSENQSL